MPAEFEVVVPTVQISAYAENQGVDLIVIGHRGKTFERWLIGSVAKKVISYAPCPMPHAGGALRR